MTFDEKIGLLHGPMALPYSKPSGEAVPIPEAAIPAAGYLRSTKPTRAWGSPTPMGYGPAMWRLRCPRAWR
jgi:hypothetical protein